MTLEIDCDECGHRFRVPRSMKGGLANCPDCKQAVPVGGGPEALFWIILGLAVGGDILISAVVFFAAGATAGLVTAGILTAVIVVASLFL